jgi:hypothetical protein
MFFVYVQELVYVIVLILCLIIVQEHVYCNKVYYSSIGIIYYFSFFSRYRDINKLFS